MKKKKSTADKGYVWRSILLMSSIFALHIFLIIVLVVLVIILQGFLDYTLWIFLGGLGLIGLSGFLIWRRFIKNKESLSNLLNDPTFKGRDVEVSFLGGAVNLRLGAQNKSNLSQQALQGSENQNIPQLEDKDTIRVRELNELSRLMEKGILTDDEFQRAKKKLLDDES